MPRPAVAANRIGARVLANHYRKSMPPSHEPGGEVTITSSVIYIFDSYRFRPDGRLMRDGTTVRLPPTESKLLELLLRSRGHVLSHRTIEEEVWPRQTVGYSSLARCIYSLRKALGESRQNYIQTVPKRGYRFAKPVATVSIDPPGANLTLDDLEPVDKAYFLEGLRESARASAEALELAVERFETVCVRVPNFLQAFEELANCRINQINRGYIEPAYGRRKGIEAAEAALIIDPNRVDANVMLAFLYGTIDGKASGQIARLDAKIERPTNSARALLWRSSLEKCAGNLDAGLRCAEAATRCDPFSISARFVRAWSLYLCGHAGEALDIARESAADMPWVPYGSAFTAMFAAGLGELELAKEEALRALNIAPENFGVMILAAYALACAGLGDGARRIVARTTGTGFPRAPLSHAAAVHAALGEAGQARALLDQARKEEEPWFCISRYDPRLAGIYPDTVQQADTTRFARS